MFWIWALWRPPAPRRQRAKESLWGARTCWQPPLSQAVKLWCQGQLKPPPQGVIDLEDPDDDVITVRAATESS